MSQGTCLFDVCVFGCCVLRVIDVLSLVDIHVCCSTVRVHQDTCYLLCVCLFRVLVYAATVLSLVYIHVCVCVCVTVRVY